jgi:alkanesulfonate monooxygenase SsuD/methylene tetrahydromethanopterin reductase-like flavin-dependent oxidoreductase (luciferase family)
VSFGEENTLFGKEGNRITIPLPLNADFAAMMAIGYFFIGHMQAQLFPYYKNRIEAYVKETSEMFGTTISPIVE